MSYLSLARKYRPNTFSDLVGQESVGLALANAIRLKREPRGVIFTGVRGIGKTTTARIYAKALNCENGPTPEPCNVCASCVAIQQGTHEDVLEIDGASNTGVDDVRALQETLAYVPQRSTFKIYIIDEVHMLSVSAFNALLKTLEEPPEHVVFIFATTELHKVPETIQSRCQVFHLQKISTALTKKRIAGILVSEGIEFEDRAIQWIAREGKGSLRDALTLLDQVIAVGGGRVEWSAVEPMVNTGHAEPIFEMLGMLIVKDSAGILAVIARWDQEGLPMTVLVEELVKACRNAFVLKSVSQSAGDIELMDVEERELEALRLLGASAQVLDLNRLFRSFVKCLDDLRNSELDRFVVENYALEWCLDPGLPDLTSLMHGVGAVGKAVGVASPVGRSQVGAGIGAASPVVSSAVVGVGVGEAAKPSMDLRDRWKKASGQQAAPTVSVEAKIGASVSEGLTPAKSVVQAQVQVESNDHFAAKAIVQSHVAAAPQPSAPVYGAPSAPLKQSQVTAQGFVATSAQPLQQGYSAPSAPAVSAQPSQQVYSAPSAPANPIQPSQQNYSAPSAPAVSAQPSQQNSPTLSAPTRSESKYEPIAPPRAQQLVKNAPPENNQPAQTAPLGQQKTNNPVAEPAATKPSSNPASLGQVKTTQSAAKPIAQEQAQPKIIQQPSSEWAEEMPPWLSEDDNDYEEFSIINQITNDLQSRPKPLQNYASKPSEPVVAKSIAPTNNASKPSEPATAKPIAPSTKATEKLQNILNSTQQTPSTPKPEPKPLPTPTQPSSIWPTSWKEFVDQWKKQKPLQARVLEETYALTYSPTLIKLAVESESLAGQKLLHIDTRKKLLVHFESLFGFNGTFEVIPKSEIQETTQETLLETKQKLKARERDDLKSLLENHPLTREALSEFDGTIESIEVQ